MSDASVFPNSFRRLKAVTFMESLSDACRVYRDENAVAIIFVSVSIFENMVGMGGTRMKAVLVHRPGGPEALQYQDVPTPQLGESDVLIRAETFGVGQPDKLIRSGVYKWMPPLPAN